MCWVSIRATALKCATTVLNFEFSPFFTESFQFTHTGPAFNVSHTETDFVNVNHPLPMAGNLKYRTTMTAPSGSNLQLIVPTRSARQNCTEGNFLQVNIILKKFMKNTLKLGLYDNVVISLSVGNFFIVNSLSNLYRYTALKVFYQPLAMVELKYWLILFQLGFFTYQFKPSEVFFSTHRVLEWLSFLNQLFEQIQQFSGSHMYKIKYWILLIAFKNTSILFSMMLLRFLRCLLLPYIMNFLFYRRKLERAFCMQL